jgi:hypothetical protein
MNAKLLFAAAVAASALTALPASAQYFSYRPQTITVREHSREFTVDRGDQLYWELRAGPYHFKDGVTYTYTNRCWSGGDECLVRVFDPYGDVPNSTTTAPPVGRISYYSANRYGDYEYDND